MSEYKLNIASVFLIIKSKKDFICFTLDETETKVVDYILTNDLTRYRKQYQQFRLLDIVKKENINTINL